RAMLTVTQDFTLTRCRKLGISVLILFLAVSIVPRSEAQVRESAKAKEIWVESEDTSAPIELGMPSFAPIIDKLGQAVVNISTRTKAEETRNPFGRNAPSPFDLFSQFPQQRREMRSLGS